tara:strand:- start:603 stop:986 length:384 start_codon:yes stop_codon:yes gene_type:complete
MNKSNILKTFNNHFEDFMTDILRVFPDDSDLITCQEAILTLRKNNPKIIINVFKTNVIGPYRNEIKNNDINFFINKNYTGEIDDKFSKQILQKIDLLREPVRKMDDEDKSKVIKYLNNLLKLCDLYN